MVADFVPVGRGSLPAIQTPAETARVHVERRLDPVLVEQRQSYINLTGSAVIKREADSHPLAAGPVEPRLRILCRQPTAKAQYGQGGQRPKNILSHGVSMLNVC